MKPSAESAARIPVLPRLARPANRVGVVGPAKLALRQYLADYERDLGGAFREHADAEQIVAARAAAVDRVLDYAWHSWLGEADDAALIAVGGYGRAELFPYSDVDLLILTVESPEPRVMRAIEAFCAGLWDLGIKPGMAVRDLDCCRELAGQDVSVYTNLIEARFLVGSRELAERLLARLPDESLWTPARFLEAKRAEQTARHQRFGDTAYNLEPQLKEGPGGLRDLQLIGWLGREIAGSGEPAQMVEAGLLDATEAEALGSARTTLFRIRHALHLLARRAEERLLFDYQRELARLLGYRDEHADNLGVEQCMQDYYRAARRIAGTNEELIARCSEMLATSAADVRDLGDGFRRIGDRLDVDASHRLQEEPQTLIALYALIATEPGIRGLRANALRQVRLAMANPAFDLDRPEVFAALRELLERGAAAVEALAAMARHGVLARLIPGFARVTGRMQYDLFHVYTVDEHTMRVLRFMARFASEDGARDFPLAHTVYQRIPQPALLLLAGLFHDIAKGRGGDHSVLGEEDARVFCARLGLRPAAVDRVAWLVRQHLLMSVTAQRQDITDPAVVHRFAEQVDDWERLDYLYLLTVADINGTSPKLWNTWRDRLLSDLYAATRYVLREESGELPKAGERVAETRARATSMLEPKGLDPSVIARIWADFPEESFLRYRPEQIAWQTAAIATHDAASGALVRVNPLGVRGTSEVFVYSPDRDGLFATITAVLDRAQLNVVEARVISAHSDMVLDTFYVLDASGKPLPEGERVEAIELALRSALGMRVLNEQPVRRALPRTLRHFHIVPRIVFSVVAGRTRLGLVCTDRPGLLASVAQTFRSLGVRVHDARIATFGERVEDFFRISDENDRLLDEAGQEALRAALLEQLDLSQPERQKVMHANP
ncbi:UTP--GlnB (protein PII) uridylyltransferase, GlnD [Dokdonella immobilis]|uniref:Bifunctional uridylyltransferase/uridylyl-removing enzyme n=1 Tax=Dokdonella immobilis TaxID=578942 RepID=A0A1I4ZFL5_9GAMM|nr:UTP--GlnB (protein PII) uridylyltransferase, GlnD [Dokdonella immobilis]